MKKIEDRLEAEGKMPLVRRLLNIGGTALHVLGGALATVVLIGVICGFTFMGTLGDYLETDVLPDAIVDLDSYSLEQNSYLYNLLLGIKVI